MSQGQTTFTVAEAGFLIEWLGETNDDLGAQPLDVELPQHLNDPDYAARDMWWGIDRFILLTKLGTLSAAQQQEIRVLARRIHETAATPIVPVKDDENAWDEFERELVSAGFPITPEPR